MLGYRHVCDIPRADLPSLPAHADGVTLGANVGDRVWCVSWTQPHPVYQTAWHVQREYAFDTAIGIELAEYAASRLAPERLALALGEAR